MDAEPTEEINELTGAETGRWQVWTRDSVHIFDFNSGTVTRMPGPNAESGVYDNQPSVLRDLYTCRVGTRGVWTMEADWRAPYFKYLRQVTSVIRLITRVPRYEHSATAELPESDVASRGSAPRQDEATGDPDKKL
jgi:hypothetical protein